MGSDAHLCGEPFLHLPAVGLHQGLILTPGLIEHTVQVHSGSSVHLYVEAVSKLAAQGVDFLVRKGQKMSHRTKEIFILSEARTAYSFLKDGCKRL